MVISTRHIVLSHVAIWVRHPVFLRFAKLVFLGVFLLIISHQIGGYENILEQIHSKDLWRHSKPALLILAASLSMVNWLCEMMKWKVLQKTGLRDALRTVLSGLAVGFMTPARLGDYVGRGLESGSRSKRSVIYDTFLSSVSQNFFNVTIGAMSLVVLGLQGMVSNMIAPAILIGILAAAVFTGLMVFQSAVLGVAYKVTRGWLDFRGYERGREVLIQMVMWAGIRYVIYTLQYVLVLAAFGISSDYYTLAIFVALVFMIQSGIPLPAGLAGLARLEIAILIFSYHFDNEFLILVSALYIWIINVLLPALLGAVIIMKKKNFGK